MLHQSSLAYNKLSKYQEPPRLSISSLRSVIVKLDPLWNWCNASACNCQQKIWTSARFPKPSADRSTLLECSAIKSQHLHPRHCTEALPPRCLMSGERAPGENLMFLMAPLWNLCGGQISIKENIGLWTTPISTGGKKKSVQMERGGKLLLWQTNSDQLD